MRRTPDELGPPKVMTASLLSVTVSERVPSAERLLLDDQTVINLFDTLNRACQFYGSFGGFLGIDKATQLHDTLERFNINLHHLQFGITENRRLDLSGQNRIVKIFSGAF